MGKSRNHHENPVTKHLSDKFESRLQFESSWSDKVADFFTSVFGTIPFLFCNALLFVVWIVLNTGILQIAAFDPFPFGLLTTIVSIEAIFLSIVVLISQNRQGHISNIRQQMDFEIDVRTEEEISKILDLLDQMRDHRGMRTPDTELEAMKEKIDLGAIRRQIESE